MMRQGAIVLPAVTRDMMEPSAMRRVSIPINLEVPVDDGHRIAPILAVHVSVDKVVAASRLKFSRSTPLRLHGLTSRFT